VIKLHIGCGDNLLDGWVNADIDVKHDGVRWLDATEPLPYADDSVGAVFTEHFIEHLTYPQGRSLLAECHRVLEPGGRIRVTTPDLDFLWALYRNPTDPLHSAYIHWATKEFIPWAPYPSSAMVINNYVRDWGHQFIYDRATLSTALIGAGFSYVEWHRLGQSEWPHLRDLENPARMPEGMLALESMTAEAVKL